ncbi:MAG: DUF4395 family protein [Dehalococcoidia bacterium]|jgi:hypothetical protein|nr:DUF4395 family protein [Dehalococcoidia bacterium]MDP7083224.1 DUF4395 family protein [Dehalococcoidia bacterium]HJN86508.1 DUF4395 family protein [Dehalococcoidia bacterium]
MATKGRLLSTARLNRLHAQGYFDISDADLSDLAFGNRFAYILCVTITAIGVATANIPTLLVMTAIAFLGAVLPNHPFDYVYNHVLRGALKKPKLPRRSRQLKFTCVMATLWLIATVLLFNADLTAAGYVLGGLLVAVALTVSTTDFCIPSMIHNFIFRVKVQKTTAP